ncbi:hypothetical protein ACFXPN_07880 [Streptomyces griseorubiginosus]|uniref:hypothetical protein n=1 Tax=Streptomyces griseorubiginosus TaxID=67304 RepID=UPI0036BDF1FE
MTTTHVRQVLATLALAVLTAALPASVPATGRLTGSTVTTTVEAKADGPGPCCKSVELTADAG